MPRTSLPAETLTILKDAAFMSGRCAETVPPGWAVSPLEDRPKWLEWLPLRQIERSATDQLLGRYPDAYPLRPILRYASDYADKMAFHYDGKTPSSLPAADSHNLRQAAWHVHHALLLIRERQAASNNSDDRLPPLADVDQLIRKVESIGPEEPGLDLLPRRGGGGPPRGGSGIGGGGTPVRSRPSPLPPFRKRI